MDKGTSASIISFADFNGSNSKEIAVLLPDPEMIKAIAFPSFQFGFAIISFRIAVRSGDR